MKITANDLHNLSKVESMASMFADSTTLKGPANIGNWNTAKVTVISYTFYAATAFNQPIGKWNTDNVTDIIGMFSEASAFNQPISNWNTTNVTDMQGMFENATAFNQQIGEWNTAEGLTCSTTLAFLFLSSQYNYS